MYDHRSPRNRKQARKALARLMPLAQARADELEAAGTDVGIAAGTQLDAAMRPHISLSRFCGVHLYEVGPGMHHADIELKGMPVGSPFVFGTPAAAPESSYEEAQAWAVDAIAAYILAERRGKSCDLPEMAFVPFEIDGMTFSIPRAHIEAAQRLGYFAEDYASFHIERLRRAMGGRLTPDGYAALSRLELNFLNVAMVSMLLAGTPRYPRTWPRAH